MARRAIFVLPLAALLAAPPVLAAGAQQPKPAAAFAEDPVVARVNGTEIHRSEVLAMQRGLPPQMQQMPIEKIYPQLLDEMVSEVLVEQAARKAKLADDPEVKKRLAVLQIQVMKQAYIDRMLRKEITEAKLRARYDKFVKNAPAHEEIKARHILVPTEDEAKAVIAQLNKGADFAALAKEKTTDPAGKTSGGDLGWFTRDEMVPAFADAAFKLKKGAFTETPVKTQFGWHVIEVEDRRPAKPPTFEQAKAQLGNEMSRELIAERVKELSKTAKIEAYALDGSRLGPPPAAAAAPGPAAAPAATPSLLDPGAQGAPGAPTLAPDTAPDKLQQIEKQKTGK